MQTIDLGTPPAGRDGVRAREAFEAVNANFAELDQRAAQAQSTADAASHVATQNTQSIADAVQRVGALELDKVDKVPGKGLSEEDFTTGLKEKLQAIEPAAFRGLFATLGDLIEAEPVGAPGWYAFIEQAGQPTKVAIWSVSASAWQVEDAGAAVTPEQVKQLYESNADTNAFTDAAKEKVDGIAEGAQVNAAAVTQAEAEAGTGTALRSWAPVRVWQAIAAWWAASAMKTKLDGIASGATANDSDVNLRKRSTHTGEQGIDTITGLGVALGGKLTNPMTTTGDMIVGGEGGNPTRLSKGAPQQVLTAGDDGLPRWSDLVFTRGYASTPQTIVAAGSLTLNHGLGRIPVLVQAEIVCVAAEQGFDVGDVVLVSPPGYFGSQSNGFSFRKNATNLVIRFGSVAGVFIYPNVTTGVAITLTNANWRFIARAWA